MFEDPNHKPPMGDDDPLELNTSGFFAELKVKNYRILRKIGEGGMGEVYEAEQREPVTRRVALKVIKMGMDTQEVISRFESERQALALMNHQNIARVFDAGSTDRGQPYFAMEYVTGVPITDYCDQNELSIRKRLRLFMRVCEGVQHAHQKGVIHRDIKPTNVMVMVQDDRAIPKIIDFGLAKATAQRTLTDRTLFTQLGQLIGTPEYMSPEQAEMSGLDVDTRTDVYSLGMLLYQLLAGDLPFDVREFRRGGLDGIRRKILEEEPLRPSTRITTSVKSTAAAARHRRIDTAELSKRLKGDLDWIVMRALEKDRTRRYASASELAADIERHLTNQPVLAGPPSALYKIKKFVMRHKVGVAAGAVVVLALILGITGTTIGLIRAVEAQRLARAEAEVAQQVSGFLEDLFLVSDPGESRGNSITARELLDSGAERISVDLRGQPLVQARLMTTMGRVYRRLGLYDQSRLLLDRALVTRRGNLPSDDAEVVESELELAWVLDEIGEFDAALQLYQHALDVKTKQLGPDDSEVAKVMSSLAGVYTQKRFFEEAQSLQERALAIREHALGPDDPEVSNSLNLLANLHERQGEYDKALPLYERALGIREKALGPDHPRVAMVLNNIGNLYWRKGNLEAALPPIERALAIQEKVLGPDHPDVAFTLTNLANIHAASGELAEAQRYHERALAIREKHLRYDHPTVADTYYNLACVSALQGEKDLALKFLNESVSRGFAKRVIFNDSDLASLRGDPQFESIIDRMKRRLDESP